MSENWVINTPFDHNITRIYIIGFMGSGKTHFAERWSEELEWDFIDLDEWIEQTLHKSISEIFEKSGEDYFRLFEQKSLLKTANFMNTIIACGGGTPCYYDNMEWMNQNGLTIFINVDEAELCQRLAVENANRPMIKGKNKEALQNYVQELLSKRMKYYQEAQVTLNNPPENIKISSLLH